MTGILMYFLFFIAPKQRLVVYYCCSIAANQERVARYEMFLKSHMLTVSLVSCIMQKMWIKYPGEIASGV